MLSNYIKKWPLVFFLRNTDSPDGPWPRLGNVRRGTQDKKCGCINVIVPQGHFNQETTSLNWIPSAEQSNGVLVHGRLCPTKFPGQQDGVLQHVRETHPERPVHRLHPQRRQAYETPSSRVTSTTEGFCSEVRKFN